MDEAWFGAFSYNHISKERYNAQLNNCYVCYIIFEFILFHQNTYITHPYEHWHPKHLFQVIGEWIWIHNTMKETMVLMNTFDYLSFNHQIFRSAQTFVIFEYQHCIYIYYMSVYVSIHLGYDINDVVPWNNVSIYNYYRIIGSELHMKYSERAISVHFSLTVDIWRFLYLYYQYIMQ